MGWSSLLAKKRILQLLAYMLGALAIWVMAGCGGGGAGSMGGKVALTIAWPAVTSKYIPPYAHSLSFTLYAVDTVQPDLNLVVNRPDTLPLVQQVEFNGPIIPGHYLLKGLAKTSVNGNGDTVATATNNVTVLGTGTTTVAMTLASTLYSLQLLDMPLAMQVGQNKTLNVKVLDKNNVQVFLPNNALSWSMVFGAAVVSVDSQGDVTANKIGVARVRVSEIGAGLYSDGDITVSAVGPVFHHPTRAKAFRKRK